MTIQDNTIYYTIGQDKQNKTIQYKIKQYKAIQDKMRQYSTIHYNTRQYKIRMEIFKTRQGNTT